MLAGKFILGPHRSKDARIKTAFADIAGGLNTVLQMFKDDCGRYPTTQEGLKVLINQPTNDLAKGWHGPYIDLPKTPRDPWGHEYVYRCPGIHNTNGYDLYSLGPDGVSNSGDDIANWQMPQSPR